MTGLIFSFSYFPEFYNMITLLLIWSIFFYVSVSDWEHPMWGTTYHAEATGQHSALQASSSTSSSTKGLIITNPKSGDLVFSPCPNSTLWPRINHSSVLNLSFLICETMDSTRRRLKNLPVLKCDSRDIGDDEDETSEPQLHSDSLNELLRGS